MVAYANLVTALVTLQQNEPSRFLQELPEDYLDKSYSGGGARATKATAAVSVAHPHSIRMNGAFGSAAKGRTTVRSSAGPAGRE